MDLAGRSGVPTQPHIFPPTNPHPIPHILSRTDHQPSQPLPSPTKTIPQKYFESFGERRTNWCEFYNSKVADNVELSKA